MIGESDSGVPELRPDAVRGIDNLAELAAALRQLRRRHARRGNDSPLTYRELAAKTGWALGAVGDYLGGRRLPPTDRFDVLVRLLGADAAEQGLLATARDRVEERRRPAGETREPQAAAGAVPDQLPAGPRYFTGRQEQLARLLRPRADSATPALPIWALDGMAGVGKTALAVLAARRLTETGRYPDGSLFLDLHGFSGRGPLDPAEALAALLRGLAVPASQLPACSDARAALFRTVTARRRVLIVLDNARDEAQVRPLLPGSPDCLVLVTSRRRMTGLDDADHITLDPLPLPEAVRLFRATAGPQRDPGDPGTVERIVRLCGLLPLAVRIAGARLRTSRALTGRLLLQQLGTARDQDRLVLLDDGERSVAAALEVSYQQLTADQQRALAALGLHPGVEFEPYAAAALLGTTPGHARRLLDELERVNLLDQPAAGRYRFHDLTGTYAAGRHTAAGLPVRAALDRLYDHYAGTASAAMDRAYPFDVGHRPPAPASAARAPELTDAAGALVWLDAEVGNLIATAHHAAAGGRPAHTVHQSATLRRYLQVRHAHGEAIALHRSAAELARASGDRPAQTAALNALGHGHYCHGRYVDAIGCHTRALELARSTGNTAGEVAALAGLGWVHRIEGRHGQAVECFTAALELARSSANLAAHVDLLDGLGRVHHAQGRYEQAGECFARALTLARSVADRGGEMTALNGLGWMHQRQGRWDEAVDCHTQALHLASRVADYGGEFNALHALSRIHVRQRRYGPAAQCHTRALELARTLGDADDEVAALAGLALVDLAQGSYPAARERFEHVLEFARAIGNRNWQYEAHLGLGHTLLATREPRPAAAAYRQALDLARELDQEPDQVRAHDGLARAHRALARPDQARHHWLQALRLLTALGTPGVEDVTVAGTTANLATLAHPAAPTPEPPDPTPTRTRRRR